MAQFFGLATPADGSRVYFATPLRQKGTSQPAWGKLFQVDASGLQLVLFRDEVPTPPSPPPSYAVVTNAYDIVGADVSSDGEVLAVNAYMSCYGGSSGTCQHAELGHATVTTPTGQRDYEGVLRLSPNGNWGFAIGALNFTHPFPPLSVVNIQTGEKIDHTGINGDISTGLGRAIADDGTAVVTGPGLTVAVGNGLVNVRALYIFSGTATTIIPAPNSSEAVIDAAADVILFSICPKGYPDSSCTVNQVNAARDGYTRVLENAYSPSMSDDGTQVLYLSMRDAVPQARIASTDGSGDLQITGDPTGVQSAILSGDGSTAYLLTLGGRLLKISIVDGSVQELIPRTPFLNGVALGWGFNNVVAPCELVQLTGVGLSDTTIEASQELPESLGGVQVSIQGQPARIQKVQPTAITVLVPPNIDVTRFASAEFRLITSSPSPFETDPKPLLAGTAMFAPWLLSVNPNTFGIPTLFAVHEDWSALVTDANPARPEEIVHAYGSGLGPTLPSIPCGAVAPVNQAIPLTTPFRCIQWNTADKPVEVTFQGLAPGTAGYYQFDFRIPAQFAADQLKMYCTRDPASPWIVGSVPVSPVQ